MWKEFKAFINQGNVMGLAVGVIIGGAAGKIIDSVVNDLLMPVIASVTGTVDYSNMFMPLGGQTAAVLADAKKLGPVLAYGNFLTIIINFVILAFCVFLMVKWVASIMPKEAPAPAPGPSEKDYLKEIRDALVKGRSAGA